MTQGVYRHHKGGYYRVVGTAVDSTNKSAGRLMVIYVSLLTGRQHVREAREFREYVVGVPRFQFVGECVP